MPGRHELFCDEIGECFKEDVSPIHLKYTSFINPDTYEQTVFVVFCPGDDSYTAVYQTEPSINHIDVLDDDSLLATINERNFKKELRNGEVEVFTGRDRDLGSYVLLIAHREAKFN